MVDTLKAVVWALITTASFEEALLKVVNLGKDSDTTGAIAGGLAALYYGYQAIPEAWLAEIKKREWIEELCEKADLRTAPDRGAAGSAGYNQAAGVN